MKTSTRTNRKKFKAGDMSLWISPINQESKKENWREENAVWIQTLGFESFPNEKILFPTKGELRLLQAMGAIKSQSQKNDNNGLGCVLNLFGKKSISLSKSKTIDNETICRIVELMKQGKKRKEIIAFFPEVKSGTVLSLIGKLSGSYNASLTLEKNREQYNIDMLTANEVKERKLSMYSFIHSQILRGKSKKDFPNDYCKLMIASSFRFHALFFNENKNEK